MTTLLVISWVFATFILAGWAIRYEIKRRLDESEEERQRRKKKKK
tara:strand:- start:212 stop:346 length:135 start_codon:yes stop_codon:yes gene_type:complete